jgi:hypothetical protein
MDEDKQNQKHVTQKKRRTDPQKTGVLEKGKQIMFFIIFSLWYSYREAGQIGFVSMVNIYWYKTFLLNSVQTI